MRGDPDGCGLDLSTLRYSPSSELRIEQASEDLLNIKKGWLMKQGSLPDQVRFQIHCINSSFLYEI